MNIIALLELSSIPSNLYKGINIVSKLTSIQASYAGVCGTLLSKTAIAVLANPGGKIPLLPTPVQGTKVQFSYLPSLSPFATRTTTTLVTDSNGIVILPCFSTLQHIAYSVQHNDVDFGRGKGAWSSDPMEQRWFNKDIPFAVMGVLDIPCPSGYFTMYPSGLDSLASVPKIDAGTLTQNFAGYGNVPITSVPFDVYLGTVKIGSGTTTDTGRLIWESPKPLIDLPIKGLLGKSAEIYIIGKFGTCVLESQHVSFTLPTLCTPPQVYNPVKGKCETPIPVCTPPQVYNPVTGKCETPIPVCTPPQVYNPVTGKCETPIPVTLPPAAGQFIQRIGSYCSIETYPQFNKAWFRINHDTKGILKSGIDTLDKAISQAPSECFMAVPVTPTLLKGIISIPSVPVPTALPYPGETVKISIDDVLVGTPPIYKEVEPGTRTITAKLRGFSDISKTVSVGSGETKTITDIAFAEEALPSGFPDALLTATPKPLICGNLGDIDGDGFISKSDALLLAKYTVGTVQLTEDQLKRADVRGTGTPNIVDALFIAQYVVGTRTAFPGCALICPLGEVLDPITKTCKPIPTPTLGPTGVTFFIFDKQTNKPIEGATVTLFGKSAVTNVAGNAVISPVPVAPHVITVSKAEYVPLTETVTITPGIIIEKGLLSLPIPVVIPEVCNVGDEQTISCPDGTTVVTAKCEKDPVTGLNRWVPTGKTCPPPPIPEVCNIGDEQKVTCPDGSIIVTARCEKDPVTGLNRWVPTGIPCPPLELGKQTKILVYPEGAALEAYDEQEVTIAASVICGTVPSSGEQAKLIVDGVETDFGTTSSGFVSFKWIATVEPSRTHKICVSVPKSTQCPKYGEAKDCKTITVSRVIPGVEEQLRIERAAYQAGLEALRQERERIRTLPLPAISAVPTPIIPGVTIPTIPSITVPTIPTEPEAPKLGKISIPSVKTPPGYEFPVIIYIDGVRIGSPPISIDADPGTHTVRVELKGFPTIYKKINVTAGETTSLTDFKFL